MAKKSSRKNSKKNSAMIQSFLYILLGILMLVFRDSMLDILMTIAGVVFLLFGILELVKQNWLGGGVSIIIGILIIVFGNTVLQNIVFPVLGILIIIKGVIALVGALTAKRKTIWSILFPILTVACGVVLVFAIGEAIEIVTIIGGILLLGDGILGIVSAMKK